MQSNLALGPSFKVKQWFTGFDELSFHWIQICIGSPMHVLGLVFFNLFFRMKNFSSKSTRPRDMRFLLKDTISIKVEKCSKYADLFNNIFPRAITSEEPPPKVWKFQHFVTIFSLTMDFPLFLHIDSLLLVSGLDLC